MLEAADELHSGDEQDGTGGVVGDPVGDRAEDQTLEESGATQLAYTLYGVTTRPSRICCDRTFR